MLKYFKSADFLKHCPLSKNIPNWRLFRSTALVVGSPSTPVLPFFLENAEPFPCGSSPLLPPAFNQGMQAAKGAREAALGQAGRAHDQGTAASQAVDEKAGQPRWALFFNCVVSVKNSQVLLIRKLLHKSPHKMCFFQPGLPGKSGIP